MIQGRQGDPLCPSSGNLSFGLRTDQGRAERTLAMVTISEMEHPHDMARQALAATGGKSNLKATRWLLERRAEVVQQYHLDVETECDPVRMDAIGYKVHVSDTEACHPSMLPCPIAVRAHSIHGPCGLISSAPGFDTDLAEGNSAKRASILPSGPVVLERHASVGSSSPYGREDIPEGQIQLKILPAIEHQDSVKKFPVSCSPEPEENGKVSVRPSTSRPSQVGVGISTQDAGNHKRKRHEEKDTERTLSARPAFSAPIAVGVKQQDKSSGRTAASLAERMRPNSISEILGQDHLLGPYCVLRSLLDGESLPCIIFGGPPGTGKTSLARLIARSASCRFVALSSIKGGGFEVQEILDEAKQAKKFGQRTVLFVETLSRFSKSQQESLLPAIEAGYVVFIGATTENPSAEIIPGLYSRCRIFTLRKLQHEHLCTAMKHAISDHERGVQVSLGDVSGIEVLVIEDEVIQYLATAADGDARVALNSLEAAVCLALGKMKQRRRLDQNAKNMAALETEDACAKEREKSSAFLKKDTPVNVLEHLKSYFQFSQEEYAKPFKKIVGGKEVGYGTTRDKELMRPSTDVQRDVGPSTSGGIERDAAEWQMKRGDVPSKSLPPVDMETALIVTMAEAKEAFQWPNAVIEKSQEEGEADLLSVMMKTLKSGDSNAAVYWLARVLEKGEEPLRIATALVQFASDEVGLADPQALPQAVACYQACQLLGAKGCTSHLMQCLVYLAMAPKSDALAQAFQLAQKVVQDGPNEHSPSHLRASATGSGKEPCYLPPSSKTFTFLR